MESKIALSEGALTSFTCPITGAIMEDPYLCIVSGNSFEKSAIRKHCAMCLEQDKEAFDPCTRDIIDNPLKGLIPNRSLRSAIQEWQTSRSQGVPLTANGSERDDKLAVDNQRLMAEQEMWVAEREKLVAQMALLQQQPPQPPPQEQEKLLPPPQEQEKLLPPPAHTNETKPLAHPKLCRTDSDIRDAVNLWCTDPRTAENKYGHISSWDVSQVTDMSKLFEGKEESNDPIGDWSVSNVTCMNSMFYKASKFNQPIGDWSVSNVTDMNRMFYHASEFNQPIGDWSVSNVTNMNSMFFKASKFNQKIGDWSVSNVKGTNFMFHNASEFKKPKPKFR